MGSYIKEGVGIIICGYEQDCFELSEEEGFGISALIVAASGLDSPSDAVMTAFEYAHTERGDTLKLWTEARDAYRLRCGRQYPPVYRVRIVVEAEALNDSEAAAWWQKKQQRG